MSALPCITGSPNRSEACPPRVGNRLAASYVLHVSHEKRALRASPHAQPSTHWHLQVDDLLQVSDQLIAQAGTGHLPTFVGGQSMGGLIASHVGRPSSAGCRRDALLPCCLVRARCAQVWTEASHDCTAGVGPREGGAPYVWLQPHGWQGALSLMLLSPNTCIHAPTCVCVPLRAALSTTSSAAC